VLTLAQDAGLQLVEEPISRDQLYVADEVFVSGTAAEIVPVGRLITGGFGMGVAAQRPDCCRIYSTIQYTALASDPMPGWISLMRP